jgi:hypothetical protein
MTAENAPKPYAGLTRVCRQIRQECLKIQWQGADIEVKHYELPQSLATFIFDEDSYKIAAGYLRINITGLLYYHVGDFQQLDTLPLLFLSRKKPDMMIKFVLGPFDAYPGMAHAHACTILTRLLGHHNKVWPDCILEGNIRSVKVFGERRHQECPQVCIALEKDQIPWHIQPKLAQATSAMKRREAVTDAFGLQHLQVLGRSLFECIVRITDDPL